MPPKRRKRYNALMRVRVLFFGRLKDIVGVAQEDAELSDGARVDDLFERYGRQFPKLAEFRPSIAASRNLEYCDWKTALAPGDEVAFLPPVSGGQGDTAEVASSDLFRLVRAKIEPAELCETLKSGQDGALVAFDGFVRDNFKGQKTEYLDYEGYEAMALTQMREIGAVAGHKFAIHSVGIVHRLGRVEVGETSVWIGVSAPHRAAAFDACRYVIDAVKTTVPIWKKEYFVGGAVWAEGETARQPAKWPVSESNL
jgi:molybdopterin synthase catalytic subunit/molybdopterin converting factor small subunit